MKASLIFVIFIALFCLSKAQEDDNVSGERIVNGQEADVADFPHVLALLDRGRYFCGASAISLFWGKINNLIIINFIKKIFFLALTAAHCLDLGTPPNLINLYGDSTSRLTGGTLYFVENYTNHPSYRRIRLSTGQTIWDHDVSVIEISQTTPLVGEFIRPTILPPPCPTACCGVCEDTVITIAGWGRTELGTIPVNLRMLNQTIVNHQNCGPFWENEITDRMFCVSADFYDSCDGDSGSGILLLDRINQVGYVR